MNKLLLLFLLFCFPFSIALAAVDIPEVTNSVENPAEDEEEPESDEENDGEDEEEDEEEEDSFLEPYYESEDDSPGCWDSAYNAVFHLLIALAAEDVRYNSNPFENAGVRSYMGDEGKPIAFSLLTGVTRTGSGQGLLLDARLLFPCPLGIAVRYEEVEPEDHTDFSLFYIEMPMQFLFSQPLSLEIGPHYVFPQDEGKWQISGGGVHLGIEYLFLDNLGVSGDYRLSWIHQLPFHDGEMHISWYLPPFELWTGWGILRNCKGEILQGVRAGAGIFF